MAFLLILTLENQKNKQFISISTLTIKILIKSLNLELCFFLLSKKNLFFFFILFILQ
jgi:hypothetical protein